MTGSAAIEAMPRVATIATMASRLETFQKVLPVIHAQVDHLYVFLDGFSSPPAFLKQFERLTVRHVEKLGDLRATTRWLCLNRINVPSIVVCVDDDIIYPADYVDGLATALGRFNGNAIVGVHGRYFLSPHESYVRDTSAIHFSEALRHDTRVHEVGGGTCGFVSSMFNVDAREWGRTGDDINIALSAERRGLPRVAVARPAGWLTPYAEVQSDSLWAKTLIDDSEKSRRMRILLELMQTSRLPQDNIAFPHRNERCPCGSGRRFKRCHGRHLKAEFYEKDLPFTRVWF